MVKPLPYAHVSNTSVCIFNKTQILKSSAPWQPGTTFTSDGNHKLQVSLRSSQLSSISFSVYLLPTLSHGLRPSHTLIALSRRSVRSGNPQTFQVTPTTSGPPAPPGPHVPCSGETVLAGGCGVMDGRTRVRGLLCPWRPSRLRSLLSPHRPLRRGQPTPPADGLWGTHLPGNCGWRPSPFLSFRDDD